MRGAILATVAGVWLLQQMPRLPAPAWLVLLLAGGCLLAAAAWRFPRMRRGAWLLLGFGLGFVWAAALAQARLMDALDPAWEGRDIQLVGRVASLPQLKERGERFLFDVETVLTPQAEVPARLSLTRYYGGFRDSSPAAAQAQFHPGERWRLTVRLKRPHGSYNPHGMDFELWALERNIRATGYLRDDGENLRLAAPGWQPAYLVERLRAQVRERFQRVLADARYGSVLQALAIGDGEAIAEQDWETFRRTGVIHLMSISGLHVTMVAGLVYLLVHAGWRRAGSLPLRWPARKAATLAGLAAAALYALVAGFAVPTQRTLYMLAVLAIALWSGRVLSWSRVLCCALLAVVALDPWAVLAPGFWLSFGAVALLAYAGSHRLARPGPLWQAAHAQWVVTLGLLPLLLLLFQQASLISPLANALAIPLVGLLVTPLTLLGALLPFDFLLHAAHALMAGCMALLEQAATLPLAVWQQPAPPPWTVLAALAGVAWLLLPRGFPLRWLGALALLPMLAWRPPAPAPGELKVAVLDVGQGSAVVLQTARHALLYDAGPRFSTQSDSGNRVIVPFLRGAGVARLDAMVLSHDDSDHTGGAASVLEALPVAQALTSLAPAAPLQRDLPRHVPCRAGQAWQWDGVRFAMLHPASIDGQEDVKDNNRSCVLKVESRYGSVLLPGDIERAAERELLANPAALAADVLVVPHHGSKTSSQPAFVAAVAPRVAIFTSGYRNRFGHPKAAVVARYAAAGSALYRSDRHGAVLLRLAADGIAHQGWRQQAPRYWH